MLSGEIALKKNNYYYIIYNTIYSILYAMQHIQCNIAIQYYNAMLYKDIIHRCIKIENSNNVNKTKK